MDSLTISLRDDERDYRVLEAICDGGEITKSAPARVLTHAWCRYPPEEAGDQPGAERRGAGGRREADAQSECWRGRCELARKK